MSKNMSILLINVYVRRETNRETLCNNLNVNYSRGLNGNINIPH